MHSEICQTSKMELFLGNGHLTKASSHFYKNLPLRCLMELRVRKIDDDTNNKGTSKLT